MFNVKNKDFILLLDHSVTLSPLLCGIFLSFFFFFCNEAKEIRHLPHVTCASVIPSQTKIPSDIEENNAASTRIINYGILSKV